MSTPIFTVSNEPENGAHLKLHDVLRCLVTTLTLPVALDQMLQALARLTMQAMDVDLCVILLKDQARNHFRTCVCSPDLSDKGAIIQPVEIEPVLWERLCSSAVRGQIPQLEDHALDLLNPLKNVQYKTLLPVPLFVGTDCIGLLNCYASRDLAYSSDDQLILHTIAGQAALAIKHRQCVEEDVFAQKTLIKAFINDLLSSQSDIDGSLHRRACFLGCDLKRSHLIVLVELSEVEVEKLPTSQQPGVSVISREEQLVRYEAAIEHVQQRIQEVYPGSLVDERDNILICMLCPESEPDICQLNAWLDTLVCQIRSERHVHMFAGVGNLCHSVSDYRRSHAEAKEALELGRYLDQEKCSTPFSALGAYRYIYKFARTDELQDQYQDQVASIVEYDRRKRTNLLDTLEIYLECGGNAAKTSIQLDIHRNTLLQRLERLQKLCDLDLEHIPNRLPLLIALKVYKLRAQSVQRGHDE